MTEHGSSSVPTPMPSWKQLEDCLAGLDDLADLIDRLRPPGSRRAG